MKYPSDLRKEVLVAKQKNWTLVLGGSGHLKWYDEAGRLRLTTSMTPSKGRRSIENARSKLKKCGIKA